MNVEVSLLQYMNAHIIIRSSLVLRSPLEKQMWLFIPLMAVPTLLSPSPFLLLLLIRLSTLEVCLMFHCTPIFLKTSPRPCLLFSTETRSRLPVFHQVYHHDHFHFGRFSGTTHHATPSVVSKVMASPPLRFRRQLHNHQLELQCHF